MEGINTDRRPEATATHLHSLQTHPIATGMCAEDARWKPICFAYNRGQCKYKGPGQRCARGHHVCYKEGCFRKKPFLECTHSD